MSQKLDKEYLPISGNADFCKKAIGLAIGDDHPALAEGLVSNWVWSFIHLLTHTTTYEFFTSETPYREDSHSRGIII